MVGVVPSHRRARDLDVAVEGVADELLSPLLGVRDREPLLEGGARGGRRAREDEIDGLQLLLREGRLVGGCPPCDISSR
jgi:hypothetical protein